MATKPKVTKVTKVTDTKPKRKSVAKAGLRTVTGQGSGFMTFVREQGVIGLAVGLAIGTAAGASVKVIVNEFVSPLVALLTQGINLNSMKWVLKSAHGAHAEVAIGYGAIASSIITLLATAFVIYLAVHFAKLDRLDKKKEA